MPEYSRCLAAEEAAQSSRKDAITLPNLFTVLIDGGSAPHSSPEVMLNPFFYRLFITLKASFHVTCVANAVPINQTTQTNEYQH